MLPPVEHGSFVCALGVGFDDDSLSDGVLRYHDCCHDYHRDPYHRLAFNDETAA